MAALQEDAAVQQRQVAALAARDPRDLWAADLNAFLAALDAEEAAEAGRRDELVRQQKQSRGGGGGAAKVGWLAAICLRNVSSCTRLVTDIQLACSVVRVV